jgi:predicted AlkP superfamily pyrophosphatase or phosphodiesterase
MKKLIFLLVVLFGVLLRPDLMAQDQPKLIVGIVVDQMRNDYLFRFSNHYGDDGFKRLMNQGFYAANHRFSYMPTTTGPGHASVYTGTTPAVHGIVGNNWYDRYKDASVYCAEDKSVKTVGIGNDDGQMSPRNLKTTTITDELKLFSNSRSKVIGVAIKDRGSILPAGHLADAAYWLSKEKFITSSYYMDALPQWVDDFNNRKLVASYVEKGWDRILGNAEYLESLPDSNAYERVWPGEGAPILPKDLKALSADKGPSFIFKYTPFGNTITLDFAKEAIIQEDLGKDEFMDFLTVSLSSTDYMGHAYGPRSVEIQDTYIRLDREIADFLKYLDTEIGKDQYVVFLTADHGAADVPAFNKDFNLPGGYIDLESGYNFLVDVLEAIHPMGMNLVSQIEGNEIYFNRDSLLKADLELDDVSEEVAAALVALDGIYAAYPTQNLIWNGGGEEFPVKHLSRGLHPRIAGDVIWLIESGWLDYGPTGTSHGTAWAYDTHIPFLIYGTGVKPGTTYRETHIRDIAPTLSMMFQIPLPSGTTGEPILEVLD